MGRSNRQLFLGRAASIQGETPCRYVSFSHGDKYMRKSSHDQSGLVISEVSEKAGLLLCYRPMVNQDVVVVRDL